MNESFQKDLEAKVIEPAFETGNDFARKVLELKKEFELTGNFEIFNEAIIECVAKLNSFNSTFANIEGREKIALFIKDYIESLNLGYEVKLCNFYNRAFHILAKTHSSKTDINEILNFESSKKVSTGSTIHVHTDIVPKGTIEGITLKDGVLKGRGANDMLTQLAISLINMALSSEQELTYIFTGDEEIGSHHGGRIIINKIKPEVLLDLETTGNGYGVLVNKSTKVNFIICPLNPEIIKLAIENKLRCTLLSHSQVLIEGDTNNLKSLGKYDIFSAFARKSKGVNQIVLEKLLEIAKNSYGSPFIFDPASSLSIYTQNGHERLGSLSNFASVGLICPEPNCFIVSFPEYPGPRHSDEESTLVAYFPKLLNFLFNFSRKPN